MANQEFIALGIHKYLKCCSTRGQIEANVCEVSLLLIYQNQVHFDCLDCCFTHVLVIMSSSHCVWSITSQDFKPNQIQDKSGDAVYNTEFYTQCMWLHMCV